MFSNTSTTFFESNETAQYLWLIIRKRKGETGAHRSPSAQRGQGGRSGAKFSRLVWPGGIRTMFLIITVGGTAGHAKLG